MAILEGVLSKTRKDLVLIQDGAPYHKGLRMAKFFEQNKHRYTDDEALALFGFYTK